MDNKVRETIGDVFCPTCRKEKFFDISTNETFSFYDCKKGQVCCHVFNNPFKDQKPTIKTFGGDATHCFAKKTSPNYKKEKTMSNFEEVSPQITTSTPEPEPKKIKNQSIYAKTLSIPHWLIQLSKIPFASHFIHFQSIVKQHKFLSLHRRY